GKAIVKYVKENSQDVIIMGRQAPEGSQFAVPQFVSEQLSIPLISNVVDMHMEDEQHLRVLIENNGATYEQVVTTPVVLTVGNAIISKLRVPTLKDRMKYGNHKLEYQEVCENKNELFCQTHSLEFIDRRRDGNIIDGQGAAAVDLLMEQYIEERLE
ncbi:MAG: electron transfer flavoprotein subunit beta/FixA family protein, partial [Lachnospiraceae bacterium]